MTLRHATPRWTLFAILFAALLVTLLAPRLEAGKGPRSVAAPAFNLPARQGSANSDSLRGKVVVLDFWASWCGPCRGSFPWLRRLHERFGDQGLVVVAVNLDKSRADADAFLEQFPAPFTVAFDPAGKTPDAFKVAAMPTTFVIGRDGKILYRHAGFDPRKTTAIEAVIQAACSK